MCHFTHVKNTCLGNQSNREHGINFTSKFTINFGEWFVFQIPFWSFHVYCSLHHPHIPLFCPARCNLRAFGIYCQESFASLVLRVNSACLSSAFFLAYHYLLSSIIFRRVYFEFIIYYILYQLKSQLNSWVVPDIWRNPDDLVNPHSWMNSGDRVPPY